MPSVIFVTSVATLFSAIALLSLVAAWRWPAQRRPGILLASALLLQVINSVGHTREIVAAPGAWAALLARAATVAGYFAALPWALLVENVVGRGWKSSIRRTWQVYLLSGIAALAYDQFTGSSAAASGVLQVIIAAGAVVGFANVLAIRTTALDLRVLQAGFLAFMALVVHDTLAGAGMLPWTRTSGVWNVLIFMGALSYAVLSRGFRNQRALEAIGHELEMARRIQASILPAAAPPVEGAAIVFRYVPAAAVAGDMFEFLHVDSRRFGVLLADVSGHGVPAALIASMVKVAAAAQKPHAHDPARVLSGIHAAVTGELPAAHFVTAVYIYVDLDRGELRHASAGHPPALVQRAGVRALEPAGAPGPLLISFAPAEYPVSTVPLGAGDRVVLYTDGAVEAMRGDGEMFGPERLAELIASSREPPDALASAIVRSISAFAGRDGGALDDDCTVILIEVAARR